MIANWYYDEESSCCRVGDPHSTDFYGIFSLVFYDIFLTLTPKPCGYFTCSIMVQHVSFSPNLFTIAWHVMISMTFDWRKTGLSFCRLT
jgi:hypothetical protein